MVFFAAICTSVASEFITCRESVAASHDGVWPGVARSLLRFLFSHTDKSQVTCLHTACSCLHTAGSFFLQARLACQHTCVHLTQESVEYRYSHVEAKTDTGPNMRKIEEQFGLTTARYKRTESFRRIKPEKLAEELCTGNTSDLLLLDVRDVDEFESFRLRVSSHPPCVHAARHVFRRLRLATVRHSTAGCCADLGTACGVFRGLRLSFEGGASFNGNPAQPAQTHSTSATTFFFIL